MALRSFDAAWLEAFQRDAISDIVIVSFQFAGGGGTANYISGQQFPDGSGYPALRMGLSGASPVGVGGDDFARTVTTSEIVLEFADDQASRNLFTTESMRGSTVEIRYGDRSQDWGTLERVSQKGIVVECRSQPGAIEVVVDSYRELATNADVDTFYHPKPIRELMKEVLNAGGYADAQINLESFQSINHADDAHVMVTSQLFGEDSGWVKVVSPYVAVEAEDWHTKWNNSKIKVRTLERRFSGQGRKMFAILDQLAFLSGAFLYFDEYSGQWDLVEYSDTDGADIHLTREQISDFDQSDNYRLIINRASMFGHGADGRSDIQYEYRADASAQADLWVGGNYVADERIAHDWSQSFTRLLQLDFDLTETSLIISGAYDSGFSGVWQTDGNGDRVFPESVGTTQQSEHQISSDKPAWFLLTDHKVAGKREIVKATACSLSGGYNTRTIRNISDAGNSYLQAVYTVVRANDLTPAERKGTSNQDWTQPWTSGLFYYVYDTTKERMVADRVVKRHGVGVPVVEITVPSFIGERLRIGSRVSGDMPEFIGHKQDGASSSTIFEVVGVTPHRSGDTAGVRLSLSFIRNNAARTSTPIGDVGDFIEPSFPVSDNGILGLVGGDIHDIYASNGERVIGAV